MEAFLNRLAYQESAGQISGDTRIRACREVRHVLTRIRAMGLTRPGGIAAGLGEDFAIGVGDIHTLERTSVTLTTAEIPLPPRYRRTDR
jgi:hypothetical protein